MLAWLGLEVVGRFASWVVSLFRRDLDNEEWERGARADRLPPLGHRLGDGSEDPLP